MIIPTIQLTTRSCVVETINFDTLTFKYVKEGRVLDLNSGFLSTDTSITDKSGEGNDAYLYTGRFVHADDVTDQAINADLSNEPSGRYYFVLKVKPIGGYDTEIYCQVNDAGSASVSAQGLTPNVWQEVTTTKTTADHVPSNVIVNGIYGGNGGTECYLSDVRLYRMTNTKIDPENDDLVERWLLNESSASDLDGLPAFGLVGNKLYSFVMEGHTWNLSGFDGVKASYDVSGETHVIEWSTANSRWEFVETSDGTVNMACDVDTPFPSMEGSDWYDVDDSLDKTFTNATWGNGHGKHSGCAGGSGEGIDEDVRDIVGYDSYMWFDGDSYARKIPATQDWGDVVTYEFDLFISEFGDGYVSLIKPGTGAWNNYAIDFRKGVCSGYWGGGYVGQDRWTVSNITTLVEGKLLECKVKLTHSTGEIEVTVDGLTLAANITAPIANSFTELIVFDDLFGTYNKHSGFIKNLRVNGSLVASFDDGDANPLGVGGEIVGNSATVGQKRETILQTAGMDFNKGMYCYGESAYVLAGALGFSDGYMEFVGSFAEFETEAARMSISSGAASYWTFTDASTFTAQTQQGDLVTINLATPLETDRAYTIRLEKSSGDVYLYIDGELVGSDTVTSGHAFSVLYLLGYRDFKGIAYSLDVNGANKWLFGEGDLGLNQVIGSAVVTNGLEDGKSVIVPESDITSGVDAFGNAIAEPRVNNSVINSFSVDEYVQLPAVGDLNSFTMAVYYDGTDKDLIVDSGDSPIVFITSGELDNTESATFYVNGVAGSVLNLGWNIIGISYTGSGSTSGFDEGKIVGTSGSLIAYSSNLLDASEHLQNYEALKNKYQIT